MIEHVIEDPDVILDVLTCEPSKLSVSQIEKLLRFRHTSVLGYYAHKLRLKICDRITTFISNMVLLLYMLMKRNGRVTISHQIRILLLTVPVIHPGSE